MPNWQRFGDWMRFPHLDDGAGLADAFTLAYKITDDASELWTGRFVRMKDKDWQALFGAARAFRIAVPELIGALRIDPGRAVVVPAISSAATHATKESFVYLLAEKAAEAAGVRFDPNILSKQRHRPIHGAGGAAGRDAELERAAYVATALPRGVDTVLVVDDFITRGGTMSRIALALARANPPGPTVHGVALGKTDRRSYWGQLTNDHVAPRWDGLWREGEERYLAWKAGRT